MARKIKMTPEQVARKARRDAMVAEVFDAIRDGRAYLDTFVGKRKVTGYNDETGWAVTNNTGSNWDDRSFMVCVDMIRTA